MARKNKDDNEFEYEAESTGGSAGKLSKKKLGIIISSAVAVLLVIVIVISAVFGAKSCNKDDKPIIIPPVGGETGDDDEPEKTIINTSDRPQSNYTQILGTVKASDIPEDAFEYEYSSSSRVGYDSEIIGTVERNKPVEEVKDYGLASGYPKFGSTLKNVIGTDADKVASRNALISESSFLTATGTSNAGGGGYTWMDKDGWLYSGTVSEPVQSLEKDGRTPRQLFKHSAAAGLYMGDVADDEPGIVKKVNIRPRGYNGYSVTGVYAPAGEVIKIEISEEDMNATGGLTIHIGQALYNGQANNIWAAKNQMQRIPHLLNTMNVNKNTATLENGVYTAYVGSFIGGPLYIRNVNAAFTATISGGVAYRHFILGQTTEEEFLESSKSSAPYFDLEVWEQGVLHSGPLYYAKNFTYDDLYKAAELWDKVATVTTYGSYQGIVFLYDPFVAAGAAVAFPGRRSVNCPMSWMPSSLNYNAIVTSGSWGNFHEYHHNFQGYGVGNGGEVTNNGLTLVSYALFTKISAKRGIQSFGAQGLGGWNSYTSATYALEETLKIARPNENPSNGNQGLALYAALLHNFGADAYMNARKAGGGQSYAAYMNAWQKTTHNNMYYYFKDILKGTGIENNAPSEYSMFVPVSSVYQTGRSYMYYNETTSEYEKKYFTTMQPYVIPFGQEFNIDLSPYNAPSGMYASGSVVIPDGFTYRVKSITQPSNGTLTMVDNFNFTYTPDTNNKSMTSGKIIATLEIEKNDGSFKVDDVDLVLEFELSHETNKTTLERTTYTYSADTMYKDAEQAYGNNFAGAVEVEEKKNHSNPVQNCNTDIWFYPDTPANREKYPNVPESYFVHDNTIEVIDGKLYIESEGKYRIYLRGRLNCALYYSLDGGKSYSLGATIKDEKAPANSAQFRLNDPNTYFDLEFGEEDFKDSDGVWIYIKEVLIVQSSPAVSYIGVGLSEWSDPLYTMVEKYYDANGNEVSADSEDIVTSKTVYYDSKGNEVPADIVAAAEKIAPSSASYVNAYRSSYQFPDNSGFTSEYFYERNYNYNYKSAPEDFSTWDDGTKLVEGSTNFVPWDNTTAIDNLFVEGQTTFMHSGKNNALTKGAIYFTLDMGKTVNANSVTFYGRTTTAATTAQQGLPKSFNLQISDDGVNFIDAGDYTNGTGAAYSATVNLNKTLTFRYVKITVNSSHSNNSHLVLSGIKFTYTFDLTGNGANLVTLSNNNVILSGNWQTENTTSNFGQLYVGSNGSKIAFEFTGTRLAILTPNSDMGNYEVYIDGKKVDSIDGVKDGSGVFQVCINGSAVNTVNVDKRAGSVGINYISDKLSGGQHKVEIRCTGEAKFDSVAIYSEAD